MAAKGANKKFCEAYRSSGREDINRKKKMERTKKFQSACKAVREAVGSRVKDTQRRIRMMRRGEAV
jgi:hypothetical protein